MRKILYFTFMQAACVTSNTYKLLLIKPGGFYNSGTQWWPKSAGPTDSLQRELLTRGKRVLAFFIPSSIQSYYF